MSDKTPEEIAAEEEANKKKLEAQEKQAAEFSKWLKSQKKSIKNIEEEITLLEKEKTLLEELNIIQGTTHGLIEAETEALEAKLERMRAEEALKEELIRLGHTAAEIESKGFDEIFKSNEAYTHSNELMNQLNEKRKQAVRLEEEKLNFQKEYNKAAGSANNLADMLGKKSGIFSTNIHKAAEKYAWLGKGGGSAAAFTDAMKQQFNLSNMLVSTSLMIVEATLKLVKAADTATASLAAATGMGREMNGVLVDAQKTGNLFGLSMDESSKAIQGLVANTTNFVNLSKQSQTAITTQVGLLSKLGVSATESADMIQTLNLSMGMTMEQATETTKAIAMMGVELGISTSKMVKDFKAAASTLAVYGPQATTVFKNLAGNAKAAGVEMSSLLSIAKKFDTFKEAANTVGRLNALLGTQLSTTQMLMQTEDERIETLIKSVQTSGTAFRDMDRFQQKAVAAAAGITDMNEANKIFGMNLSQFREYKEEMDENEVAQQKFNEAIDASIPIATKLMSIFNELAVLVMPILEGLHWALDGIKSIIAAIPDELKTFFKYAIMIGGVIVTFTKFWAIIKGIALGIGAIVSGITPIGWAIWGVVFAVGALWALWDSGPNKAKKLETSLYDLEESTGTTRKTTQTSMPQDNFARTSRAGNTMTQNKTSYVYGASNVTNTTNNNQPGEGRKYILQVGGKEFDAYVDGRNTK